MSNESEKIAALEERMNALDRTVQEIKEQQKEQAEKTESTKSDIIALSGDLKELTNNLRTHNEYHEKQDAKKINWFNIAIALFMAVLTLVQVVNIKIGG